MPAALATDVEPEKLPALVELAAFMDLFLSSQRSAHTLPPVASLLRHLGHIRVVGHLEHRYDESPALASTWSHGRVRSPGVVFIFVQGCDIDTEEADKRAG